MFLAALDLDAAVFAHRAGVARNASVVGLTQDVAWRPGFWAGFANNPLTSDSVAWLAILPVPCGGWSACPVCVCVCVLRTGHQTVELIAIHRRYLRRGRSRPSSRAQH
jgi:hypothetical protein